MRPPFTAVRRSWLPLFLTLILGLTATRSFSQTWPWAARAIGPGMSAFASTASDAAGNVYVLGNFSGTITCGTQTLTSVGNGDWDLVVGKISPAGQWQWAKRAGRASSYDRGNGIAVDPAGNVYVGGSLTAGTYAFDALPLTIASVGCASYAFVGKLSTNGQWQWVKASPGGSAANDVVVDPTGNVCVAGSTRSAQPFNPTSIPPYGDYAFATKLSPTGAIIWDAAALVAGGADDMAVDRFGNFYLSGRCSGAITIGTTVLPNIGGWDGFVAKLSGAGQWQWAQRIGSTATDEAVTDLAVDAAGNVYVAAQLKGAATLGTSTFTALPAVTYGIVAKCNTAGQWGWAVRPETLTAADIQWPTTLAIDASNSLLIFGVLRGGTTRFGPTSLTSSTASTMYVARLNAADGGWQWAQGTGMTDYMQSLAPGPAGSFWLVGSYANAFQLGSIALPGNGYGMLGLVGKLTFAAPTLSSFSPASGPVGSTVTLNGTNLNAATEVRFGTRVAAYTVVSATRLTAVVPAGATTGLVTVTTTGGSVVSTTSFTVMPPTITSFTPTASGAGTVVTVTGTNLAGVTAAKFGTTAVATIANVSATSVNLTVPAGATSGKISLITAGGTVLSAANFTFIPAPTITSFTPTSGGVGTAVTISGANLSSFQNVKMGNVLLNGLTLNGANQLVGVVSAGTLTGKITVTTLGGTVVSGANFTVVPAPTITSFTPTSGGVGTMVTVTGTNLTGVTAAKFNTTAVATITNVSATSVKLTVLAGATSGRISLTTAGGTVLSAANFNFIPAPTITSFTPASGGFGTVVTVTGTNLTGVTAAKFNTTAVATITNVSATGVKLTVPAGATSGRISLTTVGGTVISAGIFTKTGLRPASATTGNGPALERPSSAVMMEAEVEVYPNPAHQQVTITWPTRPATAAVELLDATGRVVRRTQPSANQTDVQLSLQALPGGLYLVRCGARTRRLVVE